MSRVAKNMWSRRRAAVRAESEAEKLAAEKAVIAEVRAGHEQKSDADILQELHLMDPDQMQAGDDFAAFMRDEVPQRLRKRALRTLWRSNPVLACVDDLVDYGDDFKAEWNATGVISTAYQVGKGMLAHVEEMERQKLAADEAASSPEKGGAAAGEIADGDAGGEPRKASAPSGPDLQGEPDPALTQEHQDHRDYQEEPPHVIVAHRMRFEFDGAA